MTDARLSMLSANEVGERLSELGALLHACVHGGASINFVLPFTQAEAEAFWARKVLPAMREGMRFVWAVEGRGQLIASVQLSIDTPPNQPHRAEVTKLIVHPQSRRQGLARGLMTELEAFAADRGRTLITLDTRTGDSAEPLYIRLGYIPVGAIPGYSRDPFDPDVLDSTTLMYKTLVANH